MLQRKQYSFNNNRFRGVTKDTSVVFAADYSAAGY